MGVDFDFDFSIINLISSARPDSFAPVPLFLLLALREWVWETRESLIVDACSTVLLSWLGPSQSIDQSISQSVILCGGGLCVQGLGICFPLNSYLTPFIIHSNQPIDQSIDLGFYPIPIPIHTYTYTLT